MKVLILKTLYPKGHPYSWTVIGEMEDLTNATVDDVKAFHKKFYSPNNATLVISGDINKEDVKTLVEKYFGEIPTGRSYSKRETMPVSLTSTVKLYHEDNFAKAPRLTMVYPSAEQFSRIHMHLIILQTCFLMERRPLSIRYWLKRRN